MSGPRQQVNIDVEVTPPGDYEKRAAAKVVKQIADLREKGQPVNLPPGVEESLDLEDAFVLNLGAAELRIVGQQPDGALIIAGTFILPGGMFAFQGKPALAGPDGNPALDTSSAFFIMPGKALAMPRLSLLCRQSGTVGSLAQVVVQEDAKWRERDGRPSKPMPIAEPPATSSAGAAEVVGNRVDVGRFLPPPPKEPAPS